MFVKNRLGRCALVCLATTFMLAHAWPAHALERLCDSSFENCRNELITRIQAEQIGIDVGAWFFEDSRFSSELIKRKQAGVPVRLIADPDADKQHPLNGPLLDQMAAAGIPIREKTSGGIEHWKAMIFAGQNVLYFGSANYSVNAFVPNVPYRDYVDETVYLTDDPDVVNSFKTKFENAWLDTTNYINYANAPNSSLARRYPIYPIDPELNWAPASGTASYRSRSVAAYNAETQRIDVIMYRITDQAHVDALIKRFRAGVPVRFYTEQAMYRDLTQPWHSYSVDRLYAAGIPIKDRAHAGQNHEKLVLLYGQRKTIFGSSNMTSKSSDSQHEHNYFTPNPTLFNWFVTYFERRWNNSNPSGVQETGPFTPLPPDTPAYTTPADNAASVATSGAQLVWDGGPWAHNYDIYFGTSATPPLYAANLNLGLLGPILFRRSERVAQALELSDRRPRCNRVTSPRRTDSASEVSDRISESELSLVDCEMRSVAPGAALESISRGHRRHREITGRGWCCARRLGRVEARNHRRNVREKLARRPVLTRLEVGVHHIVAGVQLFSSLMRHGRSRFRFAICIDRLLPVSHASERVRRHVQRVRR